MDPAKRRSPFPLLAALATAAVLAAVVLVRVFHRHAETAFIPRPTVFVTDIDHNEDLFDIANASIKGGFVKGLKTRDWEMAAKGLTPDFVGRFPAAKSGARIPDDDVELYDLEKPALGDLGAAPFLETVRGYVQDWISIERTTWRTFEYLVDPGERAAYGSVHFQLAGPLTGGGRADLSGTVRIGLVSADGKDWKIRRFEWIDGSFASTKRAPWEDVTDLVGFHLPESTAAEAVRQSMVNDRGTVTAGGLVVGDINGDGFIDVVATRTGGETVWFLNDGKGGFVRDGRMRISGDEAPLTIAQLDLDGDGVDELVTGKMQRYEGTTGWASLYVKKDGAWELRPDTLEAELAPGVRSVVNQGIFPWDVDMDGDLDLFFANYHNSDSQKETFNRVDARDGADNWLFINQGGLRFTEESDKRGFVGTQYTYVVQFFDFDGDGDSDMWEGNDFGPNHLYLNDGKGYFKEDVGHIFGVDSSYTMGVTVADWDNTGDWSMYISNMYSHAGNRILPIASAISPEMKRLGMVLAQGNQFYERRGGKWAETAYARGIHWGDWSWSSVFFDVDNDADKDLFVANGFTTHVDPKAPDF